MKFLRPFFSYYGSKARIARYYPEPSYNKLIEPFAGGAGYALSYFDLKVELYDTSPIVFGIWDYLIKASVKEILSLPDTVNCVAELDKYPQEVKWLISFNLGAANYSPRNKMSAWANEDPDGFWGPLLRQRIAKQVPFIKHWKIFNKSCFDIPNNDATWFVDPPYDNPVGRHYPQKFKEYTKLGKWCKNRKGQVIVCEQEGANWLPFESFMVIKSANKSKLSDEKDSNEAIWVKDDFIGNEVDKFMVSK